MFKNITILLSMLISTSNFTYATSLPDLEAQENLFKSIEKQSWKNKEVFQDQKQQKTSSYLVSTINLHNNMCNPSLKKEKKENLFIIQKNLPLIYEDFGALYDFWSEEFGKDYTMQQIFEGEGNEEVEQSYHNNPRQQQRILNMRDLLVFREFDEYSRTNPQTPMISHRNFLEDDVIKAISLSGTFYRYRNRTLKSLFSGMLVPGQSYDQEDFFVHTCVHGFIEENLSEIYFLPYGFESTKEIEFTLKNCFRVKYIRRKSSSNKKVTQKKLNSLAPLAYEKSDYAVATIERFSGNQNSRSQYSLRQILKKRQNTNVFTEKELFEGFPLEKKGSLPDFEGFKECYDAHLEYLKLKNTHLEKYYIIGRPGDSLFQTNDGGYAIVTNVTNKLIFNPRRSLNNDPDLFTPPKIGSLGQTKQMALDFPSVPGMSGGIVLKTALIESEGRILRIARPAGTLWGSERRFEGNKFVDLMSFVNLIQ